MWFLVETATSSKVVAEVSGKRTGQNREVLGTLDLERLYYAVGKAESGNCSTAWHQKAKNCVSIMSWKGGKRHLKPFPSYEANKQAFKKLWQNHYGNKLPDLKTAIIYTGGDNSRLWLNTVLTAYNS